MSVVAGMMMAEGHGPRRLRAPGAVGLAPRSRTRLASRWARASYRAETECQLSPTCRYVGPGLRWVKSRHRLSHRRA
jgi:hypothetical protein